MTESVDIEHNPAPYNEPGWDLLSAGDRNWRMRDWQNRRFLALMRSRGYELLAGYEEGAIEWCRGCDGEPGRGRDSYGDCAECGEAVVWVRKTQ